MFKAIAKNLIPENFRENKLITEVIDIFVDYIWENSNIAIDVNNLYNQKNTVLYEEIIKTYAANFYKTITDGSKNHKLASQVKKAHEKWGFDFDDVRLDIKAIDLLNKEQLELFKGFQQSKGTLNSIEFIYKIVEQLNIESFALETDGELKIYPGENIFEYVVEGSMLPEIFEAFVKPLAHPVGWIYLYLRTYVLKFDDYLLSKEVFNVKTFRIICENTDKEDNFKNNTGYLFETNSDGSIIYENNSPKCYEVKKEPAFNVTRLGVTYPVLTLESELCLVENQTIKTIEKSSIKGNNRITIYFESGEYLEQNSNPKSLILYYGKGPNDLNQKIKKDYTNFLNKCALDLDYDRTVVTAIKDSTNFMVSFGLANTLGRIAAVGAGNVFVGNGPYRLGDFLINPNIPVTYGTRISDKILKASSYKALYKTNDVKQRRLFSKVQHSETYHLKIERIKLYRKDGNYFFKDFTHGEIFVDCLETNNKKTNVGVKLTDDGFRLISKAKDLYIIYWDDKFNKIKKIDISASSYEETDDIKLGKYIIKTNYPPLNVYINDNLVRYNIKYNNNKWIIYLDANKDGVIQVIDESSYSETPENLQIKLLPVIFNKENNYSIKLPLDNGYLLNYFNIENNIKIKSSVNIKYNDILDDYYFDEVEISVEPPNELNEIRGEVQYLLNIKELKTIVYLENYMVDINELPISVSLDEETIYINNENDLNRENDLLKLYFDKDVRNQEANIMAIDKDLNLLESINFILKPKYNVLKTNFDSQLAQFGFNNNTNFYEYKLLPTQFLLAAFNTKDEDVKVQIRYSDADFNILSQIIEIETDKNLRLFYLDDANNEYQIEIVDVNDFDFSNVYILYYIKNNYVNYLEGEKAVIIRNLSIIEQKELSVIPDVLRNPDIDYENLDNYLEAKRDELFIDVPENTFPLKTFKDNNPVDLLRFTKLQDNTYISKLVTRIDNRYLVDLIKDTGGRYRLIFDEQVQKSQDIWDDELYVYNIEQENIHYVNDFSTHNTNIYSKYIRTRDKKIYKAAQTPENGFFCIDTFELEAYAASSGFDVEFNFDDKFILSKDILQIEYLGLYQNKWGWQSGYVDVYHTNKDLPRFNDEYNVGEGATLYEMDDYIVIGENDITKDYLFKPYPVIFNKMLEFKPVNILNVSYSYNSKTNLFEYTLLEGQYPIALINSNNDEIIVDYRMDVVTKRIIVESKINNDVRIVIIDDRNNDFQIEIGNPKENVLFFINERGYLTNLETNKAINILNNNKIFNGNARTNTDLNDIIPFSIERTDKDDVVFMRNINDTQSAIISHFNSNLIIKAINDITESTPVEVDYNLSGEFFKNGALSSAISLNEIKISNHYREPIPLSNLEKGK